MIYTLISFIIYILALPFLAVLSLRSKFHQSIPARFFLFGNPRPKITKFHIHACSLGEVVAISPLIKALQDTRISVITQTGFKKAVELSKNVRFLPFECFLPFWLSKCETLIVFEAELWLNLFKIAKKNGAKTILLNARISDKSYKSYLRFKFYYKFVFANIDLVLAQSETDKQRLINLGAKNVKVVGNIKSANLPSPNKTYQKPTKKVITIASSHQNEEKQILSKITLNDDETLFIAPRHPERFNEVDEIATKFATKFNLSYEKMSQNKGLKSRVILVDCLGELVNIYAISDIVVLCGSFEKNIGGHNPIEAAQFGCGIISGEHYFNQKPLFSAVSEIQIAKYDDLTNLIHLNLSSKITNKCDFDEVLRQIKG